MPAHGLLNRPVIVLNPTTQSGYNVRTASGAAAGTDVIVNVGPAVILSGSVLTGTPWPADCSITFIVDGIIAAPGGQGANAVATGNGNAGQAGGHGVIVQAVVRTYYRIRGAGFIAGGGGGGGGGAAGSGTGGGGPGGGGAGYPGGVAGTRSGGWGTAATDGTTTAGGNGGSGAGAPRGEPGGAGAGIAGEGWPGTPDALGHFGGAGGQPGAAIYSVGFTPPVVLEGWDSNHLKGQVKTV